MQIASQATPEGLAGHGLSTTAICFEKNSLHFFHLPALQTHVSFFFVHHNYASTAQYFIMCSIQAPWRWITVDTRTLKFVMTKSSIA